MICISLQQRKNKLFKLYSSFVSSVHCPPLQRDWLTPCTHGNARDLSQFCLYVPRHKTRVVPFNRGNLPWRMTVVCHSLVQPQLGAAEAEHGLHHTPTQCFWKCTRGICLTASLGNLQNGNVPTWHERGERNCIMSSLVMHTMLACTYYRK